MIFDFVIVGSGPAGCVLADELSKNGFNIALIDRASNDKPHAINHFFCPYVNKSPNYYTPVFSDEMGGNSLLWHSKVYLLSKNEFKNYSWPFRYNELKKYSNILSKKFKINKNLMVKSERKNSLYYRYSHRADFRNIYKYLNIKQNKKIKIFKEFSPVKLKIINNNVKNVIIRNTKNDLENIQQYEDDLQAKNVLDLNNYSDRVIGIGEAEKLSSEAIQKDSGESKWLPQNLIEESATLSQLTADNDIETTTERLKQHIKQAELEGSGFVQHPESNISISLDPHLSYRKFAA
mgnify:CR=1 FL=1